MNSLIEDKHSFQNVGNKREELSRRGKKIDINRYIYCKDCKVDVPNLIEDYASGDIICRDCGVIVMDRVIDTRGEWRSFSNDNGNTEDPSRVGGPSNPLLTGGNETIESTFISKTSPNVNMIMSRDLNKFQNKTAMTYKYNDRNHSKVFKNIGTTCERIGLPKVLADRAKSIYKKVDEQKLLKGKLQEGIIAACIYMACRQEKVPRTFREISSLTLVPKKDIGRCYKIMASNFKMFGIDDDKSEEGGKLSPTDVSLCTVSTADFMARFCSHLRLGMEIQKMTIIVCKRAQELECIAGKSPISIVAAGIYMVSQLFPDSKKQQRDIAMVAGVSEVTIKNTYKDLYPWRHKLITPDMAPKNLIDSLPIS